MDAELTVHAALRGGNGHLSLSLCPPQGEEFLLGEEELKEGQEFSASYPINAPVKWDSEHPNLYTLTARVMKDGACMEIASRRIGFRQIRREGSQVYLNGDLLKLRGINRHDIHPVTGRAITHELVEKDVRLFKEANINFIRTSTIRRGLISWICATNTVFMWRMKRLSRFWDRKLTAGKMIRNLPGSL